VSAILETPSLLRPLGIVGWDHLEPVILAALATEAPILLVGAHGTAKSLLLERLAEALDLRFRHYNASTLNFDDLAGFPVPDGDSVRYLRTPLDAWDAEAVFVDELSRCRADQQNRLFPLIHERRLQGRRLEHLRFRWAAMNPPPDEEDLESNLVYRGAEPLDAALADRFAWIITAPTRLSLEDRRALIAGPRVQSGAGVALRAAVDAVRGRLAVTRGSYDAGLVDYVDAVGLGLERGGIALSGRRLRILHDNLAAVLATGRLARSADAARLALTWSLPQRAESALQATQEEAILRAHKAAQSLVKRPGSGLRRALLAERDPVRRVGLALASDDDDLLAATVADARAGLGPAERLGLSVRLFPLLAETRPGLPAYLFEGLAEDLSRTATLREHQEEVFSGSPRYLLANEVSAAEVGLGPDERWVGEVLWTAFRDQLKLRPSQLVETCRHIAAVVPTVAAARAKAASRAPATVAA
jgi:MoxR-like ATPase